MTTTAGETRPVEIRQPSPSEAELGHYVLCHDDNVSLCGLDMSTTAWGLRVDEPMCPTCEVFLEVPCGCECGCCDWCSE